jgi:large subunit ribosomal protein L29
MNAAELREKSVDELKALDSEYRRRLFDLRFKHYTGQLVNTADLKATRRGIARIQTIIRERALNQGSAD